mmetsp:Transcript_20951/g.57640  ORF Transcript_20951/g.57640 Transcript_20951/m.57640 type:complete len:293 (-) Transcript_20951:491-1369(-)
MAHTGCARRNPHRQPTMSPAQPKLISLHRRERWGLDRDLPNDNLVPRSIRTGGFCALRLPELTQIEKNKRGFRMCRNRGGDGLPEMRFGLLVRKYEDRLSVCPTFARDPRLSHCRLSFFPSTLILQDGAGGLEFALREGRGKPVWVPVTPVPGALVCNGGDFLSLLTRGRLISPVHRVLAPTGGRERYSLVFFAYPNYDVPLKALPGWDELASAASSSSRSSVEAGASGNAAAETKIEQCGERLEYNTLFDLHGQDSNPKASFVDGSNRQGGPSTFGEWITKKWLGVYRTGY